MIGALTGSDLGVDKNSNYLLFEWSGCARIVFSIVEKGNAILCHFKAEKEALRYVKTAINEMCVFIFDQFKWCTMVLAAVINERPSIMRVLLKCGFENSIKLPNGQLYTRLR